MTLAASPSIKATLAAVLVVVAVTGGEAAAQTIDCAQLQRAIAQAGSDGGGRYAAAARRQTNELARTQALAHQLGCDGFSFFGGNPQCGGLTNRIEQMRANLAQLQRVAGGNGGGRGELVARFNAYCRGGQQAAPPPQRGFFDSLFGGLGPQSPAPPQSAGPAPEEVGVAPEDGYGARGGSQAMCVRTCDGGFFPLPISSRHRGEDLTEMCQALCPGTETAVYTRSPNSEIKTAVGLDGKPYMELANALSFTKTYSSSCSCRPAGKSWAEALANAEQVLDQTRKGDIVVTPEKSAELSRVKGIGSGAPGAAPALSSTPDPTRTGTIARHALPPPQAANDVSPDSAVQASPPMRHVGPGY